RTPLETIGRRAPALRLVLGRPQKPGEALLPRGVGEAPLQLGKRLRQRGPVLVHPLACPVAGQAIDWLTAFLKRVAPQILSAMGLGLDVILAITLVLREERA